MIEELILPISLESTLLQFIIRFMGTIPQLLYRFDESTNQHSPGLVAERLGGGGGRYLRDVEEPQQVRHLQRHRAVGTTDHPEDGSRAGGLLHPRRRLVRALQHADVDIGQGRADKVQALIERVRVTATCVEDVHAQTDARQDRGVAIDLIDGEHHRLEPLHAAMIDAGSAGRAAALLVHRK